MVSKLSMELVNLMSWVEGLLHAFWRDSHLWFAVFVLTCCMGSFLLMTQKICHGWYCFLMSVTKPLQGGIQNSQFWLRSGTTMLPVPWGRIIVITNPLPHGLIPTKTAMSKIGKGGSFGEDFFSPEFHLEDRLVGRSGRNYGQVAHLARFLQDQLAWYHQEEEGAST